MKIQKAGMITAALAAALAGCALSKTTIEERTPELKYTTKGTVALTVIDNRPYVVSGEKEERTEGVFRSGYGIPFAFHRLRSDPETPYVARISELISKSLYNGGSKVEVVKMPKGFTVADAISEMRKQPFDSGLVVNVFDSRVDAGGVCGRTSSTRNCLSLISRELSF